MPYTVTQFRISIWYLQGFVRAFVLIFPTYLIMMEASGITPLALGALMVIWSASRLAFEVPSGVIGDMFTRRTILLASGLIDAAAFAIWLLWPGFTGFALGFVVWSLSIALYSGTAEAYLYEAIEDPDDYEKLFGRSEAIAGLGVASALLLGGYAAAEGYEFPLLASIAAPLLATVIMFVALPHHHRRRDQDSETRQKFFAVLRSGIHQIGSSRRLLIYVLVFATVPVAPWVFEEYIGVLFTEQDFTLVTVGYIYAAVWFARTLGNLFAHRMRGLQMNTLLLIFLGVVTLFTTTTFLAPIMIVGGLLATHFMLGSMDIQLLAKIQDQASDHNRATIVSLASMAVEVMAMSLAILFGALAQWWDWITAAQWCGALSVGFTTLWLLGLWRTRSIEQESNLER